MTKKRSGIDRGQTVPGRKRDDQIAMSDRQAPAARSDRRSAPRANAATARSISPASRTSIGLNSTPSEGAADWMAPNWPIPAAMAGSRSTAARVTAGAISLSSSSHFAADAVFGLRKAGGVAAWPRQAISKAGARQDRRPDANTIGTVRVACCNGVRGRAPGARKTSGARAINSAACLRRSVGVAGSPAECRSAHCGPRSSPSPAGLARKRRCGPVPPDRLAARCISTPMRRIALLLRARASGIAAAPPSSAMNARRFIRSPRRRGRHVGGTVRPSAFAVLRLTASSYLVGACTGRSAGFSPFRMRST